MEKYQKKFIEKIEETKKCWIEKEVVTRDELYRFLHSIKGTAPTIGLDRLGSIAEEKMNRLEDDNTEKWSMTTWKTFLHDLLHNTTEQSSNNQEQPDQEKQTFEKLILLVDHDPLMIKGVKELLEEEGFMVLVGLSTEKAIPIFFDHNPDLVILNMNTPNSFTFFSTTKQRVQSHFTPIVTIVDKDNKDLGLKAYEHGAMDVIYKPLDRSELLVRIWNRLMYKQYINNAVLLDELTGTFNRKFLNLELERYLFEMKRTKQSFSLALLDIDHFKNVNDQYGHQMGDVVLKEFAAFILKKKRHSDYCIRFGGEEFLLLLPHTKASEAATFLDRLRSDFQDFSFSSEDRGKFTVTFSAGIVEIKDTLLTSDEHMKRADHALYEAKQAGRNQVRVYGEEKPITANSKVIRVGIIDDDTIVHEMLEERLSKLNFENHVIDLKSFREGESFFTSEWHKQNGKYLIILDGMMPRMDGLEVLQRLREKYDEKKFIVLMLTGRKSENDIVRALELGADDYLTKPFNFAELEARVKRLIARMMI